MDARTVSYEEARDEQVSHNDHPSIRPEALKKGMKVMIGGVPHKVTAVRPNGKITLVNGAITHTNTHGKKVVLILNQDGKYEIRGNK